MRKKVRLGLVLVLLAGALLSVLANLFVTGTTRNQMFDRMDLLPNNDVGLVLGTSRSTFYFSNRMKAAAILYAQGKIKHILVSGDNRHRSYNEPTDMKKALLKLGVKESDITCDYAGFRTLDSVVRAQKVFGLKKCTIISQKYHNYRALAIANHYHLEAVAFNADDAPQEYQAYNRYREFWARILAVLDLYVFRSSPKFAGPEEFLQLNANPVANPPMNPAETSPAQQNPLDSQPEREGQN